VLHFRDIEVEKSRGNKKKKDEMLVANWKGAGKISLKKGTKT